MKTVSIEKTIAAVYRDLHLVKSPLSILRCGKGDGATLHVTNLDIHVFFDVPAIGKCLYNLPMIAKGVPIFGTEVPKNQMDIEDFPVFERTHRKESHTVNSAFLTLLPYCQFAVSKEMKSSPLSCISVELDRGSIVATDGHRLMAQDIPVQKDLPYYARQFLVSPDAVQVIKTLCKIEGARAVKLNIFKETVTDDKGKKKVTIKGIQLVVSGTGYVAYFKCPDGMYPDWPKVMPTATSALPGGSFVIGEDYVTGVLMALNKINAVTNPKTNFILLSEGKFRVWTGEKDSVGYEIDAPWVGRVDGLPQGVNGKSLYEILSAIGTVNITVTYDVNPLRGVLFRFDGGMALQMPLRIFDAEREEHTKTLEKDLPASSKVVRL